MNTALKRKSKLFIFIIFLTAFAAFFGATDSRYYLSVNLSGDFLKSFGFISAYNPQWSSGYTGDNEGNGVFSIPSIPSRYPNICYSVTNKTGNKINKVECDYYIRIVNETGGVDLPVEYKVCAYATNNALNYVEGRGYGPFTLGVDVEKTTYYSLDVNFVGTEAKYTQGVQRMKVQIVKVMWDNVSLEVMDDAPLNMEYAHSGQVPITFAYYKYQGGENGAHLLLGAEVTLYLNAGTVIDFTKPAELAALGINMPAGQTFKYAVSGALTNWAAVNPITVPADRVEAARIEVYFD